jgi:hypothetical protein
MKAIPPLLCFLLVALAQAEDVKVPLLKIGGREYREATISAEGRLKVKILHSEGVARVPAISLPEEIQRELELIAIPPEEPAGEIIASHRNELQLANDFGDAVNLNKWDNTQGIFVVQSFDIGKLVKIDGGDELFFLVGDFEPRADGAVFRCIAEDTGRTYSYKTVLGASKTVRMFAASKPVNFAAFVKRLKNGDVIKIREVEWPRLCPDCKGLPKKCDTCGSAGLIEDKKTVVSRWK